MSKTLTPTTKGNDLPRRGERPTRSRESLRRWWVWLLLLCLLAAGAYIFLISPGKTQQLAVKQGPNAAARGVPVVAVPAKTGDIGIYLTGLGSVTPLNTVTVKSRIDGQLMKILFREGLTVSNALKKIEQELPKLPEVEHLVAFVRTSERGISK